MSTQPSHKATAQQATNEKDWIKLDLHIHTLDDPKDAVNFRRINCWNARSRSDSVSSRLRYTTRCLIGRKCSPMQRSWAFC